jgi:hypothetical protein
MRASLIRAIISGQRYTQVGMLVIPLKRNIWPYQAMRIENIWAFIKSNVPAINSNKLSAIGIFAQPISNVFINAHWTANLCRNTRHDVAMDTAELALTDGTLWVIARLDQLRATALRMTLSSPNIRSVFSTRAWRLFYLYLLAVMVYLPLSLFYPLWVLAIGPLIWGLPHLFASTRYIGYATTRDHSKRKTAIYFIVAIWMVVSFFRILSDTTGYAPDVLRGPELFPEMISIAVIISGLSFIFRRRMRDLMFSLAAALPVLLLMWQLPLETTGVMILLHNWLAFYYWIKATKSSKELCVAVCALLIFALLNGAVLMGWFDSVYSLWQPQHYLRWTEADASEIGRMIAPWSNHVNLFYHCVILYAFGQALHYFIWLKAIGEQNLSGQNPTSFRLSWKLLRHDFGPRLANFALLACSTIVLMFVLKNFVFAQDIYFAVAAGHGYFELAALPLTLRSHI